MAFMKRLKYHFCPWVIQNLPQIGVLASSSFKRHYRLTKIGCLDDIVQAVNMSASPNVAQPVGTQHGSTVVPMYKWSTYFDNYTIKTALKGITKMHHF